MIRIFVAILGVALLSTLMSGCAGDLNETQQNQVFSEYRCTLQPEKRCRF